jgi:hypothetical protein
MLCLLAFWLALTRASVCPQVMLDPNGQMVDFLLCAQLSGPMSRPRMEHTVFTDPRKATTDRLLVAPWS